MTRPCTSPSGSAAHVPACVTWPVPTFPGSAAHKLVLAPARRCCPPRVAARLVPPGSAAHLPACDVLTRTSLWQCVQSMHQPAPQVGTAGCLDPGQIL